MKKFQDTINYTDWHTNYMSILNESKEILEEDTKTAIMLEMGVDNNTADTIYEAFVKHKNLIPYIDVLNKLQRQTKDVYGEDLDCFALTEGKSKDIKKLLGVVEDEKNPNYSPALIAVFQKVFAVGSFPDNLQTYLQNKPSGKKQELMNEITEAVCNIVNNEPLKKQNTNHALKGPLQGMMCYHLHGDVVLYYTKDKATGQVNLFRIGSHSQVSKYKG